ncbi:MAG: PEP-CTERM sorting domain-containing protein [Dechloromonas sp.]|nr:PEP-CTERM sorting domain-containing protein [Dechloromonas sp.]
MKKAKLFAAALCAVALSAPLQASIVFDGGTPDGEDGLYANAGYVFSAAATKFSLASGLSFDRLSWWGGYAYGGAPDADDDFSFDLYKGDDGLPGELLASFSLGAGNRSATGGTVIGFLPEYRYSAGLSLTSLAAGSYFASLSNHYLGSDNWFWETTGGGSQQSSASHDIDFGWLPSTYWDATNGDELPVLGLAFRLDLDGAASALASNRVPEPGSLALLALAGLAAIGQRWKGRPARVLAI